MLAPEVREGKGDAILITSWCALPSDALPRKAASQLTIGPRARVLVRAELVRVLEQQQIELLSVDVIRVALVDTRLLALGESDLGVTVRRETLPVVGGFCLRHPDVQTAPYLWGNFASSILSRKPRPLNTRVNEGTSDSPRAVAGIARARARGNAGFRQVSRHCYPGRPATDDQCVDIGIRSLL
jgi:hypothetical protein